MRVVSGSARGTSLMSVPGDGTRPILDRVKTALFDILRPRLPGYRVLDVFAGSGSVGIEALSQGAQHCTFLDLNEKAVQTIRFNLDRCHFPHQGPEARAEVRHTDAFTFLKNSSKNFDLLYVAPPQYRGLWIEALHCIAERPQLLSPQGEVVIQIDPDEYEAVPCAQLYEQEQRRYGKTLLIFMRRSE